MSLTSKPIIHVSKDCLEYHVKGNSVDKAIADAKAHSEVKEFLAASNLGTEYMNVEFNHGEDISITIHKQGIVASEQNVYEVWFIGRSVGNGDEYLNKDKEWTSNRAEAVMMSEQQASDTCGDYNGGCGSMTIRELTNEEIKERLGPFKECAEKDCSRKAYNNNNKCYYHN